jgi:uncharacterized membrane protein
MSERAGAARRLALGAWLLLAASVGAWPLAGAGIGQLSAAIAFVPLLLPIPGLARGRPRLMRAAPMALAPVLALAVTEVLVNPPARPWAGLSLALAFAAFAGVVAALRAAPGA